MVDVKCACDIHEGPCRAERLDRLCRSGAPGVSAIAARLQPVSAQNNQIWAGSVLIEIQHVSAQSGGSRASLISRSVMSPRPAWPGSGRAGRGVGVVVVVFYRAAPAT